MKKLGSQLRTGDIVTRLPGNEHVPGLPVRLVFLMETAIALNERTVCVVDMQEAPRMRIGIRYFRPDETYEVESPEPLLDAQELSWLVTAGRYFVEQGIAHPERLPVLLDRLDPPKPPTLDEALRLLQEVGAGDASADIRINARNLVDRARRTSGLP